MEPIQKIDVYVHVAEESVDFYDRRNIEKLLMTAKKIKEKSSDRTQSSF